MIVVECYPDEKLVRALGVPRKQIRHEGGKGCVLNKIRESDAGIGLIDEDPDSHQPRELNQYAMCNQDDEFGSLRRLTHQKNTAKKIIIIRPRLEEWLLGRARASSLNPLDYGLPDNADKLHSLRRYDRKPQFENFLGELRRGDQEVEKLKSWLTEG